MPERITRRDLFRQLQPQPEDAKKEIPAEALARGANLASPHSVSGAFVMGAILGLYAAFENRLPLIRAMRKADLRLHQELEEFKRPPLWRRQINNILGKIRF